MGEHSVSYRRMPVNHQKHVFISIDSFFAKSHSKDLTKSYPNAIRHFVLGAGVYYRADEDQAVFHLIFQSEAAFKKMKSKLKSFVKSIKGDLLDYRFENQEDRGQIFMKLYSDYPVRYPGVDSFSRAWKLLTGHFSAVNDNSLAPEVRFKRDHEWIEARIHNISSHTVTVATGGSPRIGDATSIEIMTPKGPFVYRAEVKRHLHGDDSPAGVDGFIADLIYGSRDVQLHSQIITWAQRSMMDAKPVPSRSVVRIPIKWNATLIQNDKEIPVIIRDISTQGVFLETDVEAIGKVELRIPLDDKTIPIQLMGTVRRTRRSKECKGLGICFLGSLEENQMSRFQEFANRVEQRAKHRIFLVSQGQRLEHFTEHFSSVGYLVETVEKPRHLLNRIRELMALPDIIILDNHNRSPSFDVIKKRLAKHSLDVYETESDPWNTRSLIDAAFLS